MQRFTDLKVWQRAHAMALEIYRVTAAFPSDERFGLISQIRRAAVSVSANIAEGAKRRHPADFARFLNVAEGSIAEVECLTLLAKDLKYLSDDAAKPLMSEAEEISRMLNALREKVTEST